MLRGMSENSSHDLETRLRLRIHFGDLLMLGPGKAELLERIRETGSISAAGRGMRDDQLLEGRHRANHLAAFPRPDRVASERHIGLAATSN